MKSIFLAVLLVGQVTFAAQAATLVKMQTNFGDFRDYKTHSIIIGTDGIVISVKTARGKNGEEIKSKTEVALLSDSTLANLKIAVIGLDTSLKLEAEPEEGPPLDHGSQSVTIEKDGVETTIFKKSGGKTYFLEYHTGIHIIDLIKSLSFWN